MIGSSMSLFLQVDFPSSSKLVISRLFTLTDASSLVIVSLLSAFSLTTCSSNELPSFTVCNLPVALLALVPVDCQVVHVTFPERELPIP